MIVGGNIDGFTRTMTTAIALETSKGDLPLAMGLGMVLIAIVLAINALGLERAAPGRTAGGMTDARTGHRSARGVRSRHASRARRHARSSIASALTHRARRADAAGRAERRGQDARCCGSCMGLVDADRGPHHVGRPRGCAADAPRHRVPAPGDAAAHGGGECRLRLAQRGRRASERAARTPNCWRRSACRTWRHGRRGGCPAANSSGSRLRARWRASPSCCFLDEPTASLDPAATKASRTIIARRGASGIKVVMATHDLGQARRLAGDVMFLVRGALRRARRRRRVSSTPRRRRRPPPSCAATRRLSLSNRSDLPC